MCMQCAAQGITYVGGAVGVLQVMKVRAAARRRGAAEPTSPTSPSPSGPSAAEVQSVP